MKISSAPVIGKCGDVCGTLGGAVEPKGQERRWAPTR